MFDNVPDKSPTLVIGWVLVGGCWQLNRQCLKKTLKTTQTTRKHFPNPESMGEKCDNCQRLPQNCFKYSYIHRKWAFLHRNTKWVIGHGTGDYKYIV